MEMESNNGSSTPKDAASLADFYDDGFWDIFLSSPFIASALHILTGSMLSYIFVFAGLAALIIGRNLLSHNRVPKSTLQIKEKNGQRVLLLLILSSLFLIAALWFLPELGLLSLQTTTSIIFALIVPLVLFYMAYMLNFRRLYVYAVLVAIFMLVNELIGRDIGAWVGLIIGLGIMSVGFYQLNRFLKND